MSVAVWWIRRDMRLADNAALQAAATEGAVLPLFVVDPVFADAGFARREFMFNTLRELDAAMGGALVVRYGSPSLKLLESPRRLVQHRYILQRILLRTVDVVMRR